MERESGRLAAPWLLLRQIWFPCLALALGWDLVGDGRRNKRKILAWCALCLGILTSLLAAVCLRVLRAFPVCSGCPQCASLICPQYVLLSLSPVLALLLTVLLMPVAQLLRPWGCWSGTWSPGSCWAYSLSLVTVQMVSDVKHFSFSDQNPSCSGQQFLPVSPQPQLLPLEAPGTFWDLRTIFGLPSR